MFWVLIAFISPVFHGLSNILDNYLSSRFFNNTWTLIFYQNVPNLVFLSLIAVVGQAGFLPLKLLPIAMLIGLIDIAYAYPYFKALKQDDTSVVASLFSLGKVFVPIFAFILVQERLDSWQYLGFAIIIVSGALLTWKPERGLRLSRSFLYMFIASVLVALEVVLYKYIFNSVSWSTGFVWPGLFSALTAMSFILVPNLRRDIRIQAANLKRTFPLLATESLVTFIGMIGATYAISLVPVTMENSISASQPFFVLLYGLVLQHYIPGAGKEDIYRSSILKKVVLFAAIIFGITLVV